MRYLQVQTLLHLLIFFSTQWNFPLATTDQFYHRFIFARKLFIVTALFSRRKVKGFHLERLCFFLLNWNTFQDLHIARFAFWTPGLVSRFKPAIGPWKVDRRQTAAYCEAEQPENKTSIFECIGIINLISIAFKILFL